MPFHLDDGVCVQGTEVQQMQKVPHTCLQPDLCTFVFNLNMRKRSSQNLFRILLDCLAARVACLSLSATITYSIICFQITASAFIKQNTTWRVLKNVSRGGRTSVSVRLRMKSLAQLAITTRHVNASSTMNIFVLRKRSFSGCQAW